MSISDINNQGSFTLNDISTDCNEIESCDNELGVNISNTTKTKIINGQYIDLTLLLHSKIDVDDEVKQLAVKEGCLVLDNKKSQSKISTIQQWTDAFLVYSSVYLTAHPNSATSLLKYMHTVRLGASRSSGLGWKDYDSQFRMKKQSNPSISWSKVDQELWLLYMNKSSSLSSNSSSSYHAPKCVDFNYKGYCTKSNCPYKHRCMRCSFGHPSIKCKVSTFSATNNSRSGARGFSNPSAKSATNSSKLQSRY